MKHKPYRLAVVIAALIALAIVVSRFWPSLTSSRIDIATWGGRVTLVIEAPISLVEAVMLLPPGNAVMVDRLVSTCPKIPGGAPIFEVEGKYENEYVGAIVLDFARQCGLAVRVVGGDVLAITCP